MNNLPLRILRIGLAITFLWISFFIFKAPEAWGSYLKPWAADLLFVPIKQAMLATAVLDAAIGVMLLVNLWVWIAALLGVAHLVIVLAVTGIDSVTVRDIGLLAASLALAINYLPEKFKK